MDFIIFQIYDVSINIDLISITYYENRKIEYRVMCR